ncbi:hypothetical protein [Longimicrobium sp.]|uniref:hypothetical protein n=1 Tax=Longimicrobium sp. TaxID=2029185 RepID=UPI002C9041A2|nr:hypothetical protein [Longimicrobium sp.]HSU13748.1 hypothetical protein [Longimicrobium sp.]
MSTGWGLAPLTRADVEQLYEPEMEEAQDALNECLLLLHELFARYTGVRFNTQFQDEEEALRSLHDSLAPLRDVHPFWPRMAQDIDAYWRLRAGWRRRVPHRSCDTARSRPPTSCSSSGRC